MKKILIVLIVATFFASCTTSVKMGTIGTRNIDYSATYSKKGKGVHVARFQMFIIFPVQIDDFDRTEIIDMALKKEGFDFLTDTTVELTQYFIPYIYMYQSFQVSGSGWTTNKNYAMDSNIIKTYEVVKNDFNDGLDVKEVSMNLN